MARSDRVPAASAATLQPPVPITWTAGQIPAAGDTSVPSADPSSFNAQIRDAFNFCLARTVFRAHQAQQQSVPSGTFTTIQLDTVDEDSYNGWNAGTWRYSAQINGWYFAVGFVAWSGTSVTNCSGATGLRLNGQDVYQGTAAAPPGGSLSRGSPGAWGQYLRAGDYVELQGYQGTGAALGTKVGSGVDQYRSHMEIFWAAGG